VKALRKFLTLPLVEKLLLVEALLYLGLSRLALLVVPFRHIARRLGRQFPPEAVPPSTDSASPGTRQVAWAVEIMARRTPWESACLAQAMAGKFMLRRRGVPSRLSLGMRKDASGKPTAHAWLQAGEATLLGATPEPFTVLSTFVDPD
jgi:hypothetical protein